MKFNILHKMLDNPIKSLITMIALSLGLYCFFAGFYTVEEGHVGIVKRFGKATGQVNPGLHLKVPYMDSVEELEVRTRKNVEDMASSTSEQMIVRTKVSVNWTIEKAAALELYKQYGSLEQFESRILDPRFRSATKDAIPKFTAEELIQNRSAARDLIEENLLAEMAEFPVKVDNVQIENIALPQKYTLSIETKQTEKNLADAEQHKLDRQALTAQQAVNTAEAKAQSISAIAIADANAIELKGAAEAKAITAKAKALGTNKLIVKLTEAQRWDGALPATILGSGGMPILDMRSK